MLSVFSRERTLVAAHTMLAMGGECLATLVLATGLLAYPAGWRSRRFLNRTLYLWSHCWLLCTGARIKVHGREHLCDRGAFVVVSNHQSNLDSIDLALSRGSLRILTKRELFDVPVLGAALRALGMVIVDHLTPDRATIRLEAWLREGHCSFPARDYLPARGANPVPCRRSRLPWRARCRSFRRAF